MKTLHLLRHAKSSWNEPGVSDHERDLNDRGRKAAPRMGAALRGICRAQPVNCSTARRARATLSGLCESWPELAEQSHGYDEALYTFDWRELLAWLRAYSSNGEECFILGHNPALTELCNQLVGRAALDNLPTAGYLRLRATCDAWSELDPGCATLDAYQFPRDLK